MVGLVKGGLLALHGVLDHGGIQHLLVLPLQGGHRADQKVKGLALFLGQPLGQVGRPLLVALQVLVVHELVAVVPQQVAGGGLHAHPDHPLAVLLELAHQGREIAVPGHDDKGVHVALGIGQVYGVHAKAYVGRILAGLVALGYLDQVHGQLVQLLLVLGVAAPVGIGLFDHDLALFHQPGQDEVHLEALGAGEPQGQVLEVYKHRQRAAVGFHASSPKGCN